ncbi:MAG: hypothetical protein ACJ78I_10480 [Gemmatimonadaceae bacterium]
MPTPSQQPNQPPVLAVPGPWSFRYASETTAYQVRRSGSIETQSDSITQREITTNTTHEILTLNTVGDTIRFTAVVDTFSTTTQQLIGQVQPVQLPVQVSGFVVGDSLLLSAEDSASCSPAHSALITDLRNLVIHMPAQVLVGTSWRDSVEQSGCQAMIPTKSRIISSYTVSGQIEYEGDPALVIQRIDTIHAQASGAQQQHQVALEANGTGNASYYLNLRRGLVTHLVVTQDLDLAVTASGKTRRLRQSTKQEFSLAR